MTLSRERDRLRQWGKNHPGVPPPPYRKAGVPDGHKRCIMCREVKPATPEFFYWRKSYDCPASECKACNNGRAKKWKADNKPAFYAWLAEYNGRPQNKLVRNIRRSLLHALDGKQKSGATFDLLGYSPDALRRHIERTFKPGMTWANQGSYWHVDHILPVVLFDHSDPEQVRQCWALSNLRAWPGGENIEKRAKRLFLV
jgi:hypothetical protein